MLVWTLLSRRLERWTILVASRANSNALLLESLKTTEVLDVFEMEGCDAAEGPDNRAAQFDCVSNAVLLDTIWLRFTIHVDKIL